MSKVILKNPEEYIPFIIYNHLYSRSSACFTVDELKRELEQLYHITIEASALKAELDDMVGNGALAYGVNCYKRAAMV